MLYAFQVMELFRRTDPRFEVVSRVHNRYLEAAVIFDNRHIGYVERDWMAETMRVDPGDYTYHRAGWKERLAAIARALPKRVAERFRKKACEMGFRWWA